MLLSGRCIYESRNVITTGALTESGVSILSAQVIVHEQRDADPDKDISWQITAATLQGHVQSVVLVDNAAKSNILFTFPVPTQNPNVISSGFARQTEGAQLNGLFDLVSSGRGMLLIQTDLPGKSLIELPLKVESKEDWSRPYCS